MMLRLARTECRGAPQILRVRVAALESREAVPDSDHPTHPVEADDWRLCGQAGEGKGGRSDDCSAEADAADVPESYCTTSGSVE